MILVFNAIPLQVGAATTFNPVATRATTAAGENTNEVIWITEN